MLSARRWWVWCDENNNETNCSAMEEMTTRANRMNLGVSGSSSRRTNSNQVKYGRSFTKSESSGGRRSEQVAVASSRNTQILKWLPLFVSAKPNSCKTKAYIQQHSCAPSYKNSLKWSSQCYTDTFLEIKNYWSY